jgi:hypothetical protein
MHLFKTPTQPNALDVRLAELSTLMMPPPSWTKHTPDTQDLLRLVLCRP